MIFGFINGFGMSILQNNAKTRNRLNNTSFYRVVLAMQKTLHSQANDSFVGVIFKESVKKSLELSHELLT